MEFGSIILVVAHGELWDGTPQANTVRGAPRCPVSPELSSHACLHSLAQRWGGRCSRRGSSSGLGKTLKNRRLSSAGPAGGRLELARNKISSELGGSSRCFTAGWRVCGVASLCRQHGAAPDLGTILLLPLLSGLGWILVCWFVSAPSLPPHPFFFLLQANDATMPEP